jgi:outer membrane lipoprotein SlyB
VEYKYRINLHFISSMAYQRISARENKSAAADRHNMERYVKSSEKGALTGAGIGAAGGAAITAIAGGYAAVGAAVGGAAGAVAGGLIGGNKEKKE